MIDSQKVIFLFIFTFFVAKIDGKILVPVNTSRGQVIGYHFDQGNDTSQLFYGQADLFFGIPYVQPGLGVYEPCFGS